jgi:MoaA/NifB/PqqE/SkfB family radical SAM enzyme
VGGPTTHSRGNPVSLAQRAVRHARLSLRAHEVIKGTPEFLILFINSICNLTCDHCFYWRNLNKRDDLTFDELVRLSQELDPFDHLNLSGGEPFIRKEFAEICLQFINHNKVRFIYVPTNGFYTKRTIAALEQILENQDLTLFACELSLDGMPEFHNKFRGHPESFEKAMETYEALAELQAKDPRLRIHSISTVTQTNVEEIRRLTTFLFERCPRIDHHNLALIRGERKDETLERPALEAYQELATYHRRLWAERELKRFGSVVDPMLTWAKVRTAQAGKMLVPCKAGNLSGVIHANGNVAVCETEAYFQPLGNLRQKTFRELWFSEEAEAQRRIIRNKECTCTNEVFLWPSITYQPLQLIGAAFGARIWQQPVPLTAADRAKVLNGTLSSTNGNA